jgi:hypothetical protein
VENYTGIEMEKLLEMQIELKMIDEQVHFVVLLLQFSKV